MKRYILILTMIATLALCACGKSEETKKPVATIEDGGTATTQPISNDDPSYWTTRGSDVTGYLQVPYNWAEEEYEYELEEQYSLMFISPERNAMVSMIKNNYGYDPNMYDSQTPGEYILDAYIAQYESQGGQNLEKGTVEIAGYTFNRSVDCYPADVYADYDYYIYTYVTYTGDRFYTIVVEGQLDAIGQIIICVEESFAPYKK